MNSDQTYRPGGTATGSSRSSPQSEGLSRTMQDARAKAGETASKFAEVAQQAGDQAKEAAASLASEANEKARGFLNQQVAAGAHVVSNVAEAARHAAEHLEQSSPQMAGVVRGAADKVDELAENLRGQSVEDIVATASDFTRRQPALVFGLASLVGFFVFRVLKASAPPSSSFQSRTSFEGYSSPRSFEERSGGGLSAERYGTGTGRYTDQYHGG